MAGTARFYDKRDTDAIEAQLGFMPWEKGDVRINTVDGKWAYYNGAAWVDMAGGGGGGAPVGAEYLVAALHADLTAERLATDTPSVTWDFATAGQAKAKRAALTGDVTAPADDNATTIAADAVTYAKMQNVSATDRFIGRKTAGAGDPEELTGTEATARLDVFTDALKGLTPASGGGTTNFLRADGTFAAPPGGGGGDNISVNGVAATNADFDDATPSAPAGAVNVAWQKDALDPSNISANVPANAVTNTVLADMAANSVKANVGVAGDPEDLAIPANTVLGRKGADIVAETIATAQIADAQVTYAKVQNVSATDRLLGRDTAGAGIIEELTPAAVLAMLGAHSGITLQAFTTAGANTYTPTAGMKNCIVISTGGGGGGGGADAAGAADVGVGAGGGAGGTCIEAFTAAQIGASQTVTIGAAGAAGAATGAAGGAGGNTTFGALHTANGGSGGASAGNAAKNVSVQAGGAGGVPTGGLLNIDGGDGDNGVVGLTIDATDANEIAFSMGGDGGSSFWGGGGRGGVTSQDGTAADSTAGSQAGTAGKAYGSGGGGGAVLNTATGVLGGAGKAGVCLVIEFT